MGVCKRTRHRKSKHKPYGLKGWDYCSCDTHMVDVVNKKFEREKGKKEIRKELKQIK